jgi:hypothetical protein
MLKHPKIFANTVSEYGPTSYAGDFASLGGNIVGDTLGSIVSVPTQFVGSLANAAFGSVAGLAGGVTAPVASIFSSRPAASGGLFGSRPAPSAGLFGSRQAPAASGNIITDALGAVEGLASSVTAPVFSIFKPRPSRPYSA